MAKYCGKIGFIENVESSPGVWKPIAIEKTYTGDVIRNYRKWDTNSNQNNDINVNNSISIIADSYLLENTHILRYVTWMGTKWMVTNIEIQRPRLILDIGGVYNGE